MSRSYESTYAELEDIVKDLESDDISLESAIEKYEKGLELYKYCNKILNEYEGKVKILMEKENGIVEEDFDNGDLHG
ncbi:exodeoxyribonuclease VII small subunit [Anaerosphaera multitolerans]|uniref:Exodeoxyribonuclease 7 small subunit n=1 Tax=Anaerosphaera multitolerans TaxID=2487351 RepID=A0A437S7C5_9FIRM|nr:exodeoxyribonuclease VII small subunit [Anaerosphaera multitolerans]RVU54955.1 exodeoxyribonuclease VII small subunit [Anaerosphaera multitolerans]